MNDLTPVARLHRDLRKAAATLSTQEARYMVDLYYQWQEDRKRANNQVRALAETEPVEEPHGIIQWLAEQSETLESQIKGALGVYAQGQPAGRWMLAQFGIGPVLSAGFLAYLDIKKAPTAGHFWRFCGLDPTVVWAPKTKRPWAAGAKVLTWKAGQSWMKFSNHEACFYGRLYRERKRYESARNERGDTAAQAAQYLAAKRWDKSTEAFKHLSAGHLPPAQIDARARRWAVKMFLSHLQTVMWFAEFGVLPPAPYAMVFAGHAHRIDPPHAEVIPGLAEALQKQP
jgi:hypothetical protein